MIFRSNVSLKLINNKDTYIRFLLKHKSYKDKLAVFQFNKYIFVAFVGLRTIRLFITMKKIKYLFFY
ncbi:Rpn family recombination-promoting nuclease/putative transposase [Tissierella sp. MB52-C2]|uniref:Rpn family recombination-promoting nuclease/putative transposase n=1 Tax=Tissierella sp. MB52-C2 TaxID=3070999 RepID=UPI0035AB71D8